MKSLVRSAFSALAVFAAFVSGSALAAPALVTGGLPTFKSGDASPRVLRERSVSVNPGALPKAMRDGGAPVIEIAFFDDARYSILVKRTEATYSGGTAYSGVVLGNGEANQQAIIVDNGGVIVAKLAVDGRQFNLRGTPDRGYVARELVSFSPPDHPETTLDLHGGEHTMRAVTLNGAKSDLIITPPPTPRVGADNNDLIDLMIVYTAAARIANDNPVGNAALIHASIDAEVASVNTVYANSQVVQRLRLVFRGEVTYTEAGMSTALNHVTNADGVLDEVLTMRNLYGADFVSLWGNFGSECGLGWIMATERSSFQNLAFNVVGSPLCTDHVNNTLAHELGHNMGLNHDFAEAGATQTIVSPEGAPVDPGTTTITYSRGYVDLTNRFRTVMAYNLACTNLGFNCFRAPHFSNPNVSFLNLSYGGAALAPTGFATIPGSPVGGGPFEAQVLNDTRETTQNFRQAVVLGGPGTISLMPVSYTVAEGAGSVSIIVGRALGSTGAVSVNYTTVNGTATAGSDYTLTSGTLNWANGDGANKTIIVPILQDALLEGQETFTLTLSAPTGGATISAAGTTATITITDDEPDTFPVSNLLPGGYVSPNNPNANSPSTVWTVTNAEGFQSPSSLQSAQVKPPISSCCTNPATNIGTSDLTYTGVFQGGNVSFRFRLSSFDGFPGQSGFQLLIDGVVVNTANGGEIPWTLVNQPITAGTHTITWRFWNALHFACALVSNPAPTGGANCADRLWVDAIVLPLARPYDFSGEGRTDLLLRHTDGRVQMWLQNGAATTGSVQLLGAASGFDVSHVDDLNGDGKADLVFKHTDGRVVVYTMNGTTITGSATLLGPGTGFSVVGTGDFNGDGKADIVFQHTDGRVVIYQMNGVVVAGGGTILGPGTGFTVTKVADFNGDGKDDILWTHTDGRVAIWLMNGAAVAGGGTILAAGSGFSAIHTADLNGDGRADIVWRHTDGRIAMWLMNGASVIGGGTLFAGGTGWNVARTGDFNGDGKVDLLWLHTDGRAAIWLMNGFTAVSVVQIMGPGGGWTPKRTGDLDGNGKADIVWENVDGRIAIWLMDGTSLVGGGTVQNAGGGYSVNNVSQ